MNNEETKNMGHDVFISYATDKEDSTGSRDRNTADAVCTALETRGIRCWVAHRNILPGDDWLDAIIDAVDKSKVLVLVFSSNANHSKWVKDEIKLALDEDIKIIPFRIDDISPQGGMKILKVRCQWLDAFTSPMEEHIGNLVNVVCQHLGKETVISPPIIESTGENEIHDPIEPGESVKEKRQKPEKMPEAVKSVRSKGIEVYKTGKGCWEADHGDGIKMVYIPAGEFTMGSNDYNDGKPVHTVHLDGYWLGKFEVTFDHYDKYCKETNKEKPADRGWGRLNRPVINVSWEDTKEYCKWLSSQKGFNFKLPTEAQWEKAARGTDGRKYPWGDNGPDEKLANFNRKVGKTKPVGSYPAGASPYGLLDMAGNVWEWCNDWYEDDYYKKSPDRNPPGPESGSLRVLRGGFWFSHAVYLRCADRSGVRPSFRYDYAGFRLAQDN